MRFAHCETERRISPLKKSRAATRISRRAVLLLRLAPFNAHILNTVCASFGKIAAEQQQRHPEYRTKCPSIMPFKARHPD
jgi:hypothetical protein